jgi:hypothetical protein
MQKVMSTRIDESVVLFQNSFGAWKREESAEETVRRSRDAFNKSMHRNHTDKEIEKRAGQESF